MTGNGKLHRLDPPEPQPASSEMCGVLSDILGNGVDVHRCLAAQALGHIGDPAAVQPLIAALLDEDEDVRTDAAAALSDLADPRASQQLLENLVGDPCTEVKLAAIDALAKQQDDRVVPWLRRMVRARDEDVVWDEEEFYSSGWDDWLDIQIKAVSALAALKADDAAADIAAAVRDTDGQDMTETAFKALAGMGRPGIDALAGFLGEASVRIRRRAAAALADSDADGTMEPLARALADPAAAVRLAALQVLAARRPSDHRLAALLGDPDITVRAEAIRLCGRHHPDDLPGLLDDTDEPVQMATLTVLAGLETFTADEGLIDALRAKLGDGTARVAAVAAEALANVAPRAAGQDLRSLLEDTNAGTDRRLGALRGLAAVGDPAAVEALIGVVDDPARSVRLEAMSALARLARADAEWPNAAGVALLSILRGDFTPQADDTDTPDVTTAATPPPERQQPPTTMAEDADDADAFPTSTLQAMLADSPQAEALLPSPGQGIDLTPADMERLALARQIKAKKRISLNPTVVLHDDIRRFAARLLGDLCHVDVALALAPALADEDKEVRLAAADSMARIGAQLSPLPEAAMHAVMAAEATGSPEEKRLLIRALSACVGDQADDRLRTYLDHEDAFLRTEAVRALAKRQQLGAEIDGLLGDPDTTVRLSAAEAIASAGGDHAVTQLVDFAFAFEGFHSRQAARLLRELDPARANAHFLDVLRDPDRKRVWSVAIEAAGELNRSLPARAVEARIA